MKNDFLSDDEYSRLKLKARHGVLTEVERAAYKAETQAREESYGPGIVQRPVRSESESVGKKSDDSQSVYHIIAIIVGAIIIYVLIWFLIGAYALNKVPEIIERVEEHTEQVEPQESSDDDSDDVSEYQQPDTNDDTTDGHATNLVTYK